MLLWAPRDCPRIVRMLRMGRGRSKAKFDKGMALLDQARALPPLCVRSCAVPCLLGSPPCGGNDIIPSPYMCLNAFIHGQPCVLTTGQV